MTNIQNTRVSNVLVVGSGAAGRRAALAVHEAGREVVVVGKRLRKDAHAEATLRCALERRESRGAHQRSDYPNGDPRLLVNLAVHATGDSEQVLSQVPVPNTPDELAPWFTDRESMSLEGRLLE